MSSSYCGDGKHCHGKLCHCEAEPEVREREYRVQEQEAEAKFNGNGAGFADKNRHCIDKLLR